MIHIYYTYEEVEQIIEEARAEMEEACHPWIHCQVVEGFVEGHVRHAAIHAVHEHGIAGEGIVHLGEYEYHVHEGWVM